MYVNVLYLAHEISNSLQHSVPYFKCTAAALAGAESYRLNCIAHTVTIIVIVIIIEIKTQ